MNLNILIIEDETIVGLHIKKTLLTLGHTPLKIAKNAKDALFIALNNRVDLVISDINIQGNMDGIECCSLLYQNYKIPIIFVTAYKDIETLKKASEVDFIGYLVKPFREDELETMINLAIVKYGLFNMDDRYKICENYSYSHKTNELYFNSNIITLTKKEISFISIIIQAKGSIVPYENIDEIIWNGELVDDGNRRQLVYRFRNKAPSFPLLLVKGVGYKLDL